MNQWQGDLVRLRGIEPEDHAFFYSWNLDTDTQRQLAWIWFPTSRESVKEWAKQTSLEKGEKAEFFFVIENLQGDIIIAKMRSACRCTRFISLQDPQDLDSTKCGNCS